MSPGLAHMRLAVGMCQRPRNTSQRGCQAPSRTVGMGCALSPQVDVPFNCNVPFSCRRCPFFSPGASLQLCLRWAGTSPASCAGSGTRDRSTEWGTTPKQVKGF